MSVENESSSAKHQRRARPGRSRRGRNRHGSRLSFVGSLDSRAMEMLKTFISKSSVIEELSNPTANGGNALSRVC